MPNPTTLPDNTQPIDTTPHLDALIVSHEKHSAKQGTQLDALIRQNEKNNPIPVLDHLLVTLSEVLKTLKDIQTSLPTNTINTPNTPGPIEP